MESSKPQTRHHVLFPVGSLFRHKSNGHFFETIQFSNCHCVIDGSAITHKLWELNLHWKLSDEAQFAFIVENFFRSFLRAGITPHVVFQQPSTDVARLLDTAFYVVSTQIENLSSNQWKHESSMQSRVIFAEVMIALNIHHFVTKNGNAAIASYAKSLDAFVISENNFYFLADLPRGYMITSNLSLKNLRHGLMEICGKTYFRANFFRSWKCVEADKTKAFALFATMLQEKNSENLKEFIRAQLLHQKVRLERIDFDRKHERALDVARCLNFVTHKPLCDARHLIYTHMYPNQREEFLKIYEENLGDFEAAPLDKYESEDTLPVLNSYLERDLRGNYDEAEHREDEDSGVVTRDLSEDDKMFPGWFKTAVQSEIAGGYYGNRHQHLMVLLSTGCFYPLQYLQNPKGSPACIASLRTRKILYGILFQGYRQQLKEKRKDEMINGFKVEEMASFDEEMFILDVTPVWSIVDPAEPLKPIILPGLLAMESLDLAARKRIFAVAMVGDSEWLRNLSPDGTENEYRLLLLRSWAKRSIGLLKIHVIVLLLTILAIEIRYGKKSNFFPWAISFRSGETLRCPEKSAEIRYKHLQPFAQLQCVTDTALYLNFVLKFPHGARVDLVREFYSEVFFHNALGDWCAFTEAELAERLASLFDDDSLAKFSAYVDALYGDEHELERAALSSDDFDADTFPISI